MNKSVIGALFLGIVFGSIGVGAVTYAGIIPQLKAEVSSIEGSRVQLQTQLASAQSDYQGLLAKMQSLNYVLEAVPDEFYAEILFYQVRFYSLGGGYPTSKGIIDSMKYLGASNIKVAKISKLEYRDYMLSLGPSNSIQVIWEEEVLYYYNVDNKNMELTIYWWSPIQTTFPTI